MPLRLSLCASAVLTALLACAAAVAAGSGSWAGPQIGAVTKAGVLGTSPATFNPNAPLTQGALAAAIAAANTVQHPPVPPPPPPSAPEIVSSLASGATVGGTVTWQVDAPGRTIDHVAFAVDGAQRTTATTSPFELQLDTTALADGPHSLAVNVALAGGGYAIAVWNVTVANAAGAAPPDGSLADVPVAKFSLPATSTAQSSTPTFTPLLYQAAAPSAPVSIKQLDAALVAYLGLAGAAREIQQTLAGAGLSPPPNTGTEAVARMLNLRYNHPSQQDYLEILPFQPATRAEAAYSFAQVLGLDSGALQWVQQAADSFTLPALTTWQRRLLASAVHYVGYPYVWGGTSPWAESDFGVPARGGFDCSGFVWRVVKLTSYPGERGLASVLRGRTTYQMSGEVPRSARIPIGKLQPADVMFFGGKGPRSSPGIVDHTALYLGNGWFVQSSDQGVTLLPFSGWWTQYFAWGRRPLREAGLE